METKRQRTLLQNNSLHKFCEELSEELNEKGITQAVFLQNTRIDNSMFSVKDFFRALGLAKYGKKSTAELTTGEMTNIYDEVNRHCSKWGIETRWPSSDPLNY